MTVPSDRREANGREPLVTRLRAEAAEWDDAESVKALLTEAADALEAIAVEAAIQWALARAGSRV